MKIGPRVSANAVRDAAHVFAYLQTKQGCTIARTVVSQHRSQMMSDTPFAEPFTSDVYKDQLCRDCQQKRARYHNPGGSYCDDCLFRRLQIGAHFDVRSWDEILKAKAE